MSHVEIGSARENMRTVLTPRQSRAAKMGLIAPLGAFINSSLSSCICGYIGWGGLFGNTLFLWMSWYCLVRLGVRHVLARLFFDIVTVIVSYIWCVNVIHVLWSGHNPWLGYPRYANVLAAGFGLKFIGVMLLCVAAAIGVAQWSRRRRKEHGRSG